MMQAIRFSVFTILGLSLLAGCGGGGSGGTTVPTLPPVSPGLATITSGNATTVAGLVAGVALEEGIFGTIFSQNLPVAAGGTPRVLSNAARIAQPDTLFATRSGLAPCAVAGTVDIQVSVADENMPTVGDFFSLIFTDCDDGTGTVTSGSMTITVTALGGDFATGEFLLGTSLELAAFQVAEGGETSSANGTVNLEIDSTMPPITTITVSTSSLAMTTDGMAESVTNLTVTISEDDSMFPAAVTLQTSFTVSSPSIGGDVMVSTSLALQSIGEEYPFVGELEITAAGNSAIVLIALDSNSVRLQIDIDGDGATDETIDTTWDELLAAASTA